MLKPAPVDIVDTARRTPVIQVDTDLCDTCAGHGGKVQAYVYAKMPSGRTVSYCAHHGTKYWDALNAQADVVIDMRDTVLTTTETTE